MKTLGTFEFICFKFIVLNFISFVLWFENVDWPKYKGDTIFGQVPILEINENGTVVKLAQSNTIARFLARRFNLAGKTDIEQAKAEMIIDHFSDLHTLFKQAYYETNKQLKAEKTKKFSEEDLPLCISFLEKLLEQQNSQYLVGNDLTSIQIFINIISHN